MNTEEIERLIDVTRNPIACYDFYHGDYARNVCDCLERLLVLEEMLIDVSNHITEMSELLK